MLHPDNSGNKALAYLVFPLIIVVTFGAFMRYFFHSMPNWCFEISIFLYGIMIMLGGAYVHSEQKHIRVDILEKYLPTGVTKILAFISEMIVIFTCVILIFVSSPWAWDSFLLREKSVHLTSFNPPIWWFKAIVPLSTFLVLKQSIQNLLNSSKK